MQDTSYPPPQQDVPAARPILVARPLEPSASGGAANPLLLHGVSAPAALFALLIVILVGIIASFVIQVVSLRNLEPGDGDEFAVHLVAVKLFDALMSCALLTVVAAGLRVRLSAFGLYLRQFGLQLGYSVVTLVANYAYMIATIPLILLLMHYFPGLAEDNRRRMEFGSAMPLHDFRLSVALLIPVAVHEEIVFRGMLLPLLRRLLGSWWGAVAISSVAFGMLHIAQGVTGIIQITGVGVVFSIAFILTRSLLVVVLAHFTFDLLQFQLMRFMLSMAENFPELT